MAKPKSKILVGDCLDLIAEVPDDIRCIVTDPPYGVAFESFRAVTPRGKEFTRKIENDDDMDVALDLFTNALDLLSPKTAEECDLYVFTKWDILVPWTQLLEPAMAELGFIYKMLLVWDKGIPGMGDLDGNWGCGHEMIMYFKKGRRMMPKRRSAIISVDKLGSKQHIHPTEKPVALMETLIDISTDPGDLVVDPFAGSGSAIVAAQNLGRIGVGIELDAEYASGAQGRLQQPSIFS